MLVVIFNMKSYYLQLLCTAHRHETPVNNVTCF